MPEKKQTIRWFRFLTLPLFVTAVTMTIAAAKTSSSDLMFIAAAISAGGVASLLVGRLLINHPDDPAEMANTFIEHNGGSDEHDNRPRPRHAIAHR